MGDVRPRSDRTHEHEPGCDDDGWDHPGPCVVDDDELAPLGRALRSLGVPGTWPAPEGPPHDVAAPQ